MADIIQVRYDLLTEVQNRFQKQAEAVETINNSIKREVDQLSQGWYGTAATSFFNEIQSTIYPAFNRLNHVLIESAAVTNQIATTFRQAEEEAAKRFRNPFDAMLVASPKSKPDQGLIGWLSNKAREAGKAVSEAGKTVWNFIEDHRDEIALTAALVAAGVATVATGGAASPLLLAAIGATTAGGITLAVNGASAKYPWHDGLLRNTINGGLIGYGVGTVVTATKALLGTAMASPWAASVGSAAAQISGSARLGMGVARGMAFIPQLAEGISGLSTIVGSGGFDAIIPEHLERTIHTAANNLGLATAGLSMAARFGGNALIRHAWNNPLTYPLAGKSVTFQGHHIFPQNQLGRLNLPGSTLDDAVLVSSGRHSFMPNLHTKGPQSIHGMLTQGLNNLGGRGVLNTLSSSQQAQFVNGIKNQFVNQLITPIKPAVDQGIANIISIFN